MSFQFDRSIFAGMTPAALQNALASAQAAYLSLTTGGQVAAVTLTSGEITRSVTYRAANVGGLVNLINELQACLGLRRNARAGMSVTF